MALIEGLLQELEQEAQTTKRVLERVPDAHLGWKPHAKSMTLGQLAMHIAIVPGGVAEAAAQPSMQRPLFEHPAPRGASELNHWYHHRGQLSVYLRQLNVPLPSIYGPSADESPFAVPQAADAH